MPHHVTTEITLLDASVVAEPTLLGLLVGVTIFNVTRKLVLSSEASSTLVADARLEADVREAVIAESRERAEALVAILASELFGARFSDSLPFLGLYLLCRGEQVAGDFFLWIKQVCVAFHIVFFVFHNFLLNSEKIVVMG